MPQNLYMEDDNMRLYVDVQPLFIDVLEDSKNSAAASAQAANQSEQNANTILNSITSYKASIELFYAQARDNLLIFFNSYKDELISVKNSALATINTTLQNAQNMLQQIGQNFVNQAKSYADQAKDAVDNRVSLEHLNQSKALKTGMISNDSDVFADIREYAHSTFDSSKFTVVGSPNITDDGIASGFSGSNYLTLPNFSINGQNFEITASVTTPSTDYSASATVFYATDGTTTLTLAFSGQGNRLFISSGSSLFTTKFTDDLALNTTYFVKTGMNGLQAYISYSTDGINWTTKTADATANSYTTSTTARIGLRDNQYPLSAGSIDLKQFSITVDGVEVFSGNKTGIDTIKPNDYTVVGTPTISDDGIVSGFSNSNKLIATPSAITTLTSSSILELEMRVDIGAINPTSQTTSMTIGSNARAGAAVKTTNGGIAIVGNNKGGGLAQCCYISTTTNTSYICYAKVDFAESDGNGHTGSIYGEFRSLDGTILASGKSFGGDYQGTWYGIDYTNYNQFISFGTNNVTGNEQPTNLPIDLNTFKIYVDGNLVYQPCLKIPYTESKTGSKIVDSVYRSRVNDMAEQFGYANYYTLDENNNNFSLPQGEIYGMVEHLRKLVQQLSE